MTQESVWIDDHNPYWVNEELMRRAILVKPMQSHSEIYEFVALLRMSAINKDLDRGTKLHGDIMRRGLLEKSPYLGSSLISMYAKCGMIAKARNVHDELRARRLASWNALIVGYAQQGYSHDALDCLDRMRNECIPLNAITYSGVLKACGCTGSINKGKQIHDEIVNRRLLIQNSMLGTALVDMYAKCGMLARAEEMLNELPSRNVVTWNALITGHAQQEQGLDALECFERMQIEGLSPYVISFICV